MISSMTFGNIPNPTISNYDHERFALTVPYHERFLAEFKRLVPYEDRDWLKEDKMWLILDRYEVDVYGLVTEVFSQCEVVRD